MINGDTRCRLARANVWTGFANQLRTPCVAFPTVFVFVRALSICKLLNLRYCEGSEPSPVPPAADKSGCLHESTRKGGVISPPFRSVILRRFRRGSRLVCHFKKERARAETCARAYVRTMLECSADKLVEDEDTIPMRTSRKAVTMLMAAHLLVPRLFARVVNVAATSFARVVSVSSASVTFSVSSTRASISLGIAFTALILNCLGASLNAHDEKDSSSGAWTYPLRSAIARHHLPLTFAYPISLRS